MNKDVWYEIMMNMDLDSINQMRLTSIEANQIYDRNFIINKIILDIKNPFNIKLVKDVKSYLPDRVLSKINDDDKFLSIEHFSGKFYKVLIWQQHPSINFKNVYAAPYKNSTITYDELIELLYNVYLYNPKLIQ